MSGNRSLDLIVTLSVARMSAFGRTDPLDRPAVIDIDIGVAVVDKAPRDQSVSLCSNVTVGHL